MIQPLVYIFLSCTFQRGSTRMFYFKVFLRAAVIIKLE